MKKFFDKVTDYGPKNLNFTENDFEIVRDELEKHAYNQNNWTHVNVTIKEN